MNLDKAVASLMVDSEEIKRLFELGVRHQLLEDPLARKVVEFSYDYWVDSGLVSAPTRSIIEHEFPNFTFEEVDESTSWIAKAVKKRYKTNHTQDLLLTVAEMVDQEPEEAIKKLFSESANIVQNTAERLSRSDMTTNIASRRKRYEEKSADDGKYAGAPYGFPEIDQELGGIRPGEVSVIAAYTKVGKSWTLLQSAMEAQKQGYKPIVFTMEVSREDMEDRLDALYSGVSYSRLDRGQLLPQELEKLWEAQERLKDNGSILLEHPPIGERTVAHLMTRAKMVGADYVLIDQLSHMESRERHTELRNKYTEIIFDLKAMAGNPGSQLPVFMAHQMNRDSVKAKNGGGMENLADSSYIERTVDTVLGLWRTEEQKANNLAVLNCIASRRAPAYSWNMNFQLTRRSEMSVIDRRME